MNRVVFPLSIIKEVIRVLQPTHQGVTNKRTKAIVYWLGIANDIKVCRENRNSCN